MLLYAISVFCVFYFLIKRRKSSRKIRKEPPVMPGAWPIVGHLHLLAGSGVRFADFAKQTSLSSLKYGGIVTVYFGNTVLYAISDPDDCKTVSNECLEKNYLYDMAKPWLGEGLVVANLTSWKQKRKLLNPAFSHQVVNGFMDDFNNYGRKLVEDLSMKAGSGPFNFDPFIRFHSFQLICRTALGVNSDESPSLFNDYMIGLNDLLDIFYTRIRNIFFHNNIIYNWSSLKKSQDEVIGILHNVTNTVLKIRKQEMLHNYSKGDNDENKGNHKPFMDHILKLSLDDGLFNDTEIREQTDNVIAAGFESTASTNLYTLLLVGSHLDIQEKIYKELYEVLGNRQDVGKDEIPKLVYLEAVIKESMRLYPVVPVVVRNVDTDLKLKNYTLPAGASCVLMLWGLHFHPSWGSDVHEFRPERWLDPGSLPENPNTFAAFSIGRRACIGKVHAMTSMKVTLAHLLRGYRVTADVSKLQLKMDIVLKPASGYDISLERRL